jgi:hypothetical protein
MPPKTLTKVLVASTTVVVYWSNIFTKYKTNLTTTAVFRLSAGPCQFYQHFNLCGLTFGDSSRRNTGNNSVGRGRHEQCWWDFKRTCGGILSFAGRDNHKLANKLANLLDQRYKDGDCDFYGM